MRSNSIVLVALTLCQSVFSVPLEETNVSLDQRTFGLKILAAKLAAKKNFINSILGKKHYKDDYGSNARCQHGTESTCELVCQRNPNTPGCKIYNCILNPGTQNCKAIVCKTYPFAPGCSPNNSSYDGKCKMNPNAPGCQKDYCQSNPNSPGCYNGTDGKPTKPISPPIYTPTKNGGSTKYN